MARLRTDPAKAARDGFQREIRVKRAELDMTQKLLGDRIGVCPSQMSKMLADPDSIDVGRLRQIVAVLDPDPCVVLALLGYSSKAINKIRKEG